jgi:spore coat protein U-like protein
MKRRLKWIASICALAFPFNAHALLANCTIAATTAGVTFGSYNPFSAANNDSTGHIDVTCTPLLLGGGSYTIALSAGHGSFANRQLMSGANFLNYNVYADSTHTQIWGDGTGGTVPVSDNYAALLLPTTRSYTVYGRIPGSQNKPAGTYNDTLTITVTY